MSKGRICSRLNEVPNVYDKKRWKFFFTPFTITKDLWVKGDLFTENSLEPLVMAAQSLRGDDGFLANT